MSENAGILSPSSVKPKPVLIYIFPSVSSFVKNDILILEEEFSLKTIAVQPAKKILLPFSLIREKFFLIRNITNCSIVLSQFAGYHSLLPVIFARAFRRPCVIVVGGTDCVSMPSINYGNLRKPLLKWFTLKSLKFATHIIAPAASLVESEYHFVEKDYPAQGFRYFDPSIKTPFSIIFNGINVDLFKTYGSVLRRSNSFLTVCSSINSRNFRLKGVDLFIKAAECFPEYEFTIIGKVDLGFEFTKPVNVSLIDFVEHDSLPGMMSAYTFYCQLSLSEGFGVALAEAMACGCVPIVSKVGIMDFIIGDTGFLLEKHDTELLKSVIKKAISSDVNYLGQAARERVIEKFGLSERKIKLKALLKDIIETHETTTK